MAGFLASLAALAFLHQQLQVGEALLTLGIAAGLTGIVRTTWSDLPPFVTSWLDAGTLLVALLVTVCSTQLLRPLPYIVLTWPRTAGLLLAASLLGIAIGGLATTHRRLEQLVRHQTRQLAESRMNALSAQVNPHFLFNTLNTLAEVVHEDEDLAEDLIGDLASMMRYALKHSARWVTLEEEFAVINHLLRIESARLGPRLQAELVLEEGLGSTQIPGFLVQPLVENAVRHGIAPQVEGGRVEVRAERRGDRIYIHVIDDGPGLEWQHKPAQNKHQGGLHNVAERTRLSWPDGRLTLEPSTGTHWLLDLPAEKQ